MDDSKQNRKVCWVVDRWNFPTRRRMPERHFGSMAQKLVPRTCGSILRKAEAFAKKRGAGSRKASCRRV